MKVNVHLVCNDISLFNLFIGSGLFSSVTIGSAIDRMVIYDCLIVSDRLINQHDFLEAADNEQITAENTFYLVSNGATVSNLSSLRIRLKDKGITVIPPKMTEKQILDRVCEEINIEIKANRNVVSFFGADAKVGTTITAQAVAELLAENTSCTVGLLNLQGYPNFSYVKEPVEKYGLDTIKTKVFNNILEPYELRAAMIQKDSLYVLPSARTLIDLRFYQPKHAETILDIASNLFDVVIVDAGYHASGGLFQGVLNSTENRYMVATQQESCRRAYQDLIKEQIFDPCDIKLDKFMLIINRYNGVLDETNTYKLAQEYFRMTLAVMLPNINNAFWQTEIDKQTLRFYKKREYNENLNTLARMIAAQQLNIEYRDPFEKRKGIGKQKKNPKEIVGKILAEKS